MTGPYFVDTHVFVYRFDSTEPEKQRAAERWLESLWRSGTGRVSLQVLQELYSVLTDKLQASFTRKEARSIVHSLFAWRPVPVDQAVIEGAFKLQDRYSVSWRDALILSATQATGCRTLLTEDLSHDQLIEGVRIINPFEAEPPP